MNNLVELGQQLKQTRKKVFPKDNLNSFSIRIGVSRATLQKMEKGDLSVSLNGYYQAAKLLRTEKAFMALYKIEESLFDG